MRDVKITVLQNRLKEYVDLAAAGQRVLIYGDTGVIAELVPPGPDCLSWADDPWKVEGVRQGWLRPALIKPKGPPKRFPCMKLADLLADLEESRQDRDLT